MKKKKIVSIVGARPQVIKCAPVSKELRKIFDEVLVHTGQHYDENMSQLFFEELSIPKPDYNLEVGSDSHPRQLAKMMERIEEVLEYEKPELVIVYGDTNSTAAGAITAATMNIKVAHVEAGLRSYNKSMPEEKNRIITDHVSDILFTPSSNAGRNLIKEGITENVCNCGDVMFDALLQQIITTEKKSTILKKLNLTPKKYYFVTLHRPYNVDESANLSSIINAFNFLNDKVVFPVHPRTTKKIKEFGINVNSNVLLIEPVGYLDCIKLQKHSKKIITDSGGIQKEAFFMNVPCVTLRSETEWIETVEIGANILVKNRSPDKIIKAIYKEQTWKYNNCYGDGKSSKKIKDYLNTYLNRK